MCIDVKEIILLIKVFENLEFRIFQWGEGCYLILESQYVNHTFVKLSLH